MLTGGIYSCTKDNAPFSRMDDSVGWQFSTLFHIGYPPILIVLKSRRRRFFFLPLTSFRTSFSSIFFPSSFFVVMNRCPPPKRGNADAADAAPAAFTQVDTNTVSVRTSYRTHVFRCCVGFPSSSRRKKSRPPLHHFRRRLFIT